jgi:phospholipid-translocating ATPase
MLDLFGSKVGTCLVIDGPSLQICLDSFQKLFLELACTSPAVICCRCSPTQKATVVSLMRAHTGLRTAAIGDGGNDCSMILAASVGVGIVGLEGMQASLAADFSITQFSFILPLLLWHGRNAYKRSARLSQFVIHRGLIISIIQAVFSALFFFAAVPVYNGWLVVGYATFYTMLPVFSLVLDVDVEESKVYLYPELYRELQKGRPLSSKTFVIWIFQSVYQGGIIMMGVLALFEARFLNIVSITFTALIASELLNVALEIVTWHRLMVVAEVCSVLVYFASLFFLPAYFDLSFIFTWPLFVFGTETAGTRWRILQLSAHFFFSFLLCYCV